MKVVCVFFGALVAVIHGQAYVSYYGQDLHHPTLSKESNTPEEAQLYQQDNENQQDLLSKLLLKHYGFDGEEQPSQNLLKEELQHHISKRSVDYDYDHFFQEIHVPIIGKNGVPLEPPEVQRARRQHLLAHAAAKERQYYPHYNEDDYEENAYASDRVPYAPLTKSGVPVDTPEVQEARKEHFAAIRAEKARHYRSYLKNPSYHYDESPYDRDYSYYG